MIQDFLTFLFFRLGETIPGPLITSACTLAGVFLGSVLSRRTSIAAVNISSRNIASAKLRAAFAPAQVQISRRNILGNDRLKIFFDDAFLVHASAIEEFRPFASDAVAYQKAYEEYREALFGEKAKESWKTNIILNGVIKDHKDTVVDFSEKIKNILYFAEPINR